MKLLMCGTQIDKEISKAVYCTRKPLWTGLEGCGAPQVEEQPIHTVSEHAELEGRSRTFSRDEMRRQRSATSKAHEHVVSFDLSNLKGKSAISEDAEAGLKKPQEKPPPNSWVKRWPRWVFNAIPA